MEKWKTAKGFSNYVVSNCGNVYSNLTHRKLKPSKNTSGYMYVRIKDNEGKRRNMLIHRLVAIAFLPNPEDLPLVNHKDENILNNNVENLEWCTYTYNNTYNGSAIKTGMKLRGRPANNAIKVIDINSGITWDSIDSCIKSLHIRSTKVNLMIDGIIDEYKGYKIRRLIL